MCLRLGTRWGTFRTKQAARHFEPMLFGPQPNVCRISLTLHVGIFLQPIESPYLQRLSVICTGFPASWRRSFPPTVSVGFRSLNSGGRKDVELGGQPTHPRRIEDIGVIHIAGVINHQPAGEKAPQRVACHGKTRAENVVVEPFLHLGGKRFLLRGIFRPCPP